MANPSRDARAELLPGTLDMLILKVLTRGPMHGYGIARRLEEVSDAVLQVEEGSLYPALNRLRLNGWIEGEWAETERGRRARFYKLTPAGRKHLGVEASEFQRMVAAIGRVMQEA